MQYTKLGGTGLTVSRLCLGTMTFGLHARTDLDLKRQALCEVFPDALGSSKSRNVPIVEVNPLDWLRKL